MSKFDVKDKIDGYIYRLYNVLSSTLFAFDFKSKRLVEKNFALRNSHEGERCFILGTGPSLGLLTEGQVNNLKSEVLFGVNSFYKAGMASTLKPRYYALMDDLYWKDWSRVFGEVVDAFSDNPPVFITDPRAQGLVESLSLEADPIYVYAKKYPTKEMSEDISGNIYATINVVSTSILVAMYLGFKEVYLLGCDYNAFCTAGRGHCYDDEKELDGIHYNLAFFLKYYWITTEFHYLVAKLAKEKGVKIANLTPTSLLDAYPRRPVSDVL